MSNVAINIAAEFLGKKAFKQADQATAKLTKGVKNLATAVGLGFGVRGIGRAVKAFAEDDKAARALGQTLNNLGLAYGSNTETVNGYISRLETQTGVLDDELRPAMDRLLRATGDVAKSQELLNLALDISAGTGKSVTQVSQSLQKAYLGQTQALGRLGVGLSKAELTSSSFEEIQARLSVLFAGQASTAANTYAGEIAKLQVAVNNAKETIGKGFVDALKTASGSSTIEPVISAIGKIANAFAGLTRETGKFIAITKDAFTSFDLFAPEGGYGNKPRGFGNLSTSVSSQDTQKADLAAKKAAAAVAAASAAKLAALQKALVKAQQDSLKLAKARAVFDLQKIQIEAALKTKLSEEDKIRLNLMKAIEEENIDNADKYQKALEKSQEKTKELAALLATVKAMEVKDPFSTWSIDPLTASINALTISIGGVGTAITASGKEWSSFTGTVATTVIQPNLKEFSSSFKNAVDGITTSFNTAVTGLATLTTSASKTASDAAAAATTAANAALISTSSTATEAIGSSTTSATNSTGVAIATSGAATANTIIGTSQAAANALDKLYSDSNTALTNATTVTVTDFMATSSAALSNLREVLATEAANYAAAAAAASAQAAADAADLAGAGNAGSNVSITVNTGIGDPNAIAEAIAEVITNANQRGTLDAFGID